MSDSSVLTLNGYKIIIKQGIFGSLGAAVAEHLGVCTAVLVSDDIVYKLYGKVAERSLASAGFKTVSFIFCHGEANKSLETLGKLLNFMGENRLCRSDIAIALGGGITGDITGFAAAVYQRGIRYVQVPTTLLADVDSSIGGKTAVNLNSGKNQAGCFKLPALSLCDCDLLSTLPEEQFVCGYAEIIKYALLGSKKLFDDILNTDIKLQLEQVIYCCAKMKCDIVAEDEFDCGKRRLLNFGHTLGHAIEACSDYKTPHGVAVAQGMAIITRAARNLGFCSNETLLQTLEILQRYNLPTQTVHSKKELLNAITADKKIEQGSISLVVPKKIGQCVINKIPYGELDLWLEAGGIL